LSSLPHSKDLVFFELEPDHRAARHVLTPLPGRRETPLTRRLERERGKEVMFPFRDRFSADHSSRRVNFYPDVDLNVLANQVTNIGRSRGLHLPKRPRGRVVAPRDRK